MRSKVLLAVTTLLVTGAIVYAGTYTINTSSQMDTNLAAANSLLPSPFPTTDAFVRTVCGTALQNAIRLSKTQSNFCDRWNTFTQSQKDTKCTAMGFPSPCYPCGDN